MKYTWLDDYLLQKRGVTKDFQPSWNWVRYHIGGKMFAAVCLDDGGRPYYINLRLEPMNGEFLRAQYAGLLQRQNALEFRAAGRRGAGRNAARDAR